MKIIEGLKQRKDLLNKAADLRQKIGQNSAYLSTETPAYGKDQDKQVAMWMQSHSDILKEIMKLSLRIQKTNLAVNWVVELDGVAVTKTLAEWVIRRRELAPLELTAWKQLTDRGLERREGVSKQTDGQEIRVSIVRCYSPQERDRKVSAFNSEPTLIDAQLEIANAVTDLLE